MIAELQIDPSRLGAESAPAGRPDAALWARLRATGSPTALLDVLQGSPAAGLAPITWPVAAQSPSADLQAALESVDAALRARLRVRIAEAAASAAPPWQEALRWAVHLVDLPALAWLAAGNPPLPWMRREPALAEVAAAPAHRRAGVLMRDGRGELAVGTSPRALLGAWRRAWRARWPRAAAAPETLSALADGLLTYCAGFGAEGVPGQAAPVDADARRADGERRTGTRGEGSDAGRAPLERLALRTLRQGGDGPAVPYAALLLFVLDLEGVRALLVRRVLAQHGGAVLSSTLPERAAAAH